MTNPMTPSRLKEIKARCEAATEGPWEARLYNHVGRPYKLWIHKDFSPAHSLILAEISVEYPVDVPLTQRGANAVLMAHARQDLPDCVAEIKRLQGVLDEIAGVPEKYKETE